MDQADQFLSFLVHGLGGTEVLRHMNGSRVANAAMSKALAGGATKIMDVAGKPYQDRQGSVKDPCCNIWWLSQRLVEGPS